LSLPHNLEGHHDKTFATIVGDNKIKVASLPHIHS
jgi:hypothetical protein